MAYIRKLLFSSGAVRPYTSFTVATNIMKTVGTLFFLKHFMLFENITSVLYLDGVQG